MAKIANFSNKIAKISNHPGRILGKCLVLPCTKFGSPRASCLVNNDFTFSEGN